MDEQYMEQDLEQSEERGLEQSVNENYIEGKWNKIWNRQNWSTNDIRNRMMKLQLKSKKYSKSLIY